MLHSVEGIYENGRIEIFEKPTTGEKIKVIVTFLDSDKNGSVNLAELGITKPEAAETRARLSSFAEYWEHPEMEIYDAS